MNQSASSSNSTDFMLSPGEQGVYGDKFMISLFVPFLKAQLMCSSTRFVYKVPNTLLGIIPIGSAENQMPIRNLASVSSGSSFKLGRFLAGVFLLLVGVYLFQEDHEIIGILAIIAAVIDFLNSFPASLTVVNPAGGRETLEVSVIEASRLKKFKDTLQGHVFADSAQIHHDEAQSARMMQAQLQQMQLAQMQMQNAAVYQQTQPQQQQGSIPVTQEQYHMPSTQTQGYMPAAPDQQGVPQEGYVPVADQQHVQQQIIALDVVSQKYYYEACGWLLQAFGMKEYVMRTHQAQKSKRPLAFLIGVVVVLALVAGNVGLLMHLGYIPNIFQKNKAVTCTFSLSVDKPMEAARTPMLVHACGVDSSNHKVDVYYALMFDSGKAVDSSVSSGASNNQSSGATSTTQSGGDNSQGSSPQKPADQNNSAGTQNSSAGVPSSSQDKEGLHTSSEDSEPLAVTFDLPEGTYELTFTSPVGVDGSIYEVPQSETIAVTAAHNDQGQEFSTSATHVAAEEVTVDQLQTIASQLSEAQTHGVTGVDPEDFKGAVTEMQASVDYKVQLDKTIADAKAKGYQVFFGTVKCFKDAIEVYKFQVSQPNGALDADGLPSLIKQETEAMERGYGSRQEYCLFVFDKQEKVEGRGIHGVCSGRSSLVSLKQIYKQYDNQRAVLIVRSNQDVIFPTDTGAPIKEPRAEGEVLLLKKQIIIIEQDLLAEDGI